MCFENVNMIVELRPKKHVISQFVSFPPYIQRDTISRVASSPLGSYCNTNLSPAAFRIWAPAPRTASEIRNGIDTPG